MLRLVFLWWRVYLLVLRRQHHVKNPSNRTSFVSFQLSCSETNVRFYGLMSLAKNLRQSCSISTSATPVSNQIAVQNFSYYICIYVCVCVC